MLMLFNIYNNLIKKFLLKMQQQIRLKINRQFRCSLVAIINQVISPRENHMHFQNFHQNLLVNFCSEFLEKCVGICSVNFTS